MNQYFFNRNITRKLQLSVGVTAGLVLGLTLWLNYRTSRAELENRPTPWQFPRFMPPPASWMIS